MNGPGVYSLGDFAVTTPATQVGEAITGLDGAVALTFQVRMAYGSSGTNARVFIQASADQSTTWFDVACVLLGTASETVLRNLSGLTPTAAISPGDGELADDTVVDGIFGDRYRAKLVSNGTYSGQTTVSVRIVVR